MKYEQALNYIHSRPKQKNPDGFKALAMLLQLLGNPQNELKYLHIAGTNGKGSCASMLASALTKSGYKTGLNISPFVIDFTERFSINGEYISKQMLSDITEKIKHYQEYIEKEHSMQLVEFEVVTAIAFYYFYLEKCDIVCLEVGIGGRFDSTNIIKNSLVSCIMNISYDHTELLGETLDKIAWQKAGIIKPNGCVVCYPALDKAALRVIAQECAEKNAQMIVPNMREISYTNMGFMHTQLKYKNFVINQSFTGEHQSFNASVVVETLLALRKMGYNITDENIIKGIETTKFPARIERLSNNPLIILDGAHNEDGVTALTQVLRENNLYNLTAVWASLRDKCPEKIISCIAPYIKALYTVELQGPRAVSKENLAQLAREYIDDVHCCDSVENAIKMAKSNANNGVLIFGSLYLASEARQYLV